MSRDDVTALRAVYESWSRGDFKTPEVFDDNVEVVWAPDIPDGGTYHGLAGIEQTAREWLAAWDDFRIDAEEFIAVGDQVLVLITVHGRGKDSNIETEGKYAHVWEMRGGKASRLVGYSDRRMARESVGLQE